MEMICNKGRKVKKYLTALNTKKVPEKLIGRGEYFKHRYIRLLLYINKR